MGFNPNANEIGFRIVVDKALTGVATEYSLQMPYTEPGKSRQAYITPKFSSQTVKIIHALDGIIFDGARLEMVPYALTNEHMFSRNAHVNLTGTHRDHLAIVKSWVLALKYEFNETDTGGFFQYQSAQIATKRLSETYQQ